MCMGSRPWKSWVCVENEGKGSLPAETGSSETVSDGWHVPRTAPVFSSDLGCL